MASDDIKLSVGLDQTSLEQIRKAIESRLSDVTVKLKSDPSNASLLSSKASIGKIEDLAKVYGNASKEVRKLTEEQEAAAKAAKDFAGKVGETANRFLAYVIPAGIIFKLTTSLRDATSEVIELNAEINKLSQVFDNNSQRASKVSSNVAKIAEAYGQSTKELLNITRYVAQVSDKFGGTDDGIIRTVRLLAQSNLLSGFGSIKETTDGVIASLNQFHLAGARAADVIDNINQLSKKFPVDAGELFGAIKTAGASFATAGGKFNDFTAIIAATKQLTGLSGDTIAGGLNTIAQRQLRPDVIRFTEQLTNGNIRNADGSLKNITERFIEIGKAVKDFDAEKIGQILTTLSGERQGKLFAPLLQDIGKGQGSSLVFKALKEGQIGIGSASRDAANGLNRIDVQLQSVGAKFSTVFADLAKDKGLQNTVKALADLAKAGADALQYLAPLVPLLGAMGAIKLTQLVIPRIPAFNQGLLGKTTTVAQEKRAARLKTAKEVAAETGPELSAAISTLSPVGVYEDLGIPLRSISSSESLSNGISSVAVARSRSKIRQVERQIEEIALKDISDPFAISKNKLNTLLTSTRKRLGNQSPYIYNGPSRDESGQFLGAIPLESKNNLYSVTGTQLPARYMFPNDAAEDNPLGRVTSIDSRFISGLARPYKLAYPGATRYTASRYRGVLNNTVQPTSDVYDIAPLEPVYNKRSLVENLSGIPNAQGFNGIANTTGALKKEEERLTLEISKIATEGEKLVSSMIKHGSAEKEVSQVLKIYEDTIKFSEKELSNITKNAISAVRSPVEEGPSRFSQILGGARSRASRFGTRAKELLTSKEAKEFGAQSLLFGASFGLEEVSNYFANRSNRSLVDKNGNALATDEINKILSSNNSNRTAANIFGAAGAGALTGGTFGAAFGPLGLAIGGGIGALAGGAGALIYSGFKKREERLNALGLAGSEQGSIDNIFKFGRVITDTFTNSPSRTRRPDGSVDYNREAKAFYATDAGAAFARRLGSTALDLASRNSNTSYEKILDDLKNKAKEMGVSTSLVSRALSSYKEEIQNVTKTSKVLADQLANAANGPDSLVTYISKFSNNSRNINTSALGNSVFGGIRGQFAGSLFGESPSLLSSDQIPNLLFNQIQGVINSKTDFSSPSILGNSRNRNVIDSTIDSFSGGLLGGQDKQIFGDIATIQQFAKSLAERANKSIAGKVLNEQTSPSIGIQLKDELERFVTSSGITDIINTSQGKDAFNTGIKEFFNNVEKNPALVRGNPTDIATNITKGLQQSQLERLQVLFAKLNSELQLSIDNYKQTRILQEKQIEIQTKTVQFGLNSAQLGKVSGETTFDTVGRIDKLLSTTAGSFNGLSLDNAKNGLLNAQGALNSSAGKLAGDLGISDFRTILNSSPDGISQLVSGKNGNVKIDYEDFTKKQLDVAKANGELTRTTSNLAQQQTLLRARFEELSSYLGKIISNNEKLGLSTIGQRLEGQIALSQFNQLTSGLFGSGGLLQGVKSPQEALRSPNFQKAVQLASSLSDIVVPITEKLRQSPFAGQQALGAPSGVTNDIRVQILGLLRGAGFGTLGNPNPDIDLAKKAAEQAEEDRKSLDKFQQDELIVLTQIKDGIVKLLEVLPKSPSGPSFNNPPATPEPANVTPAIQIPTTQPAPIVPTPPPDITATVHPLGHKRNKFFSPRTKEDKDYTQASKEFTNSVSYLENKGKLYKLSKESVDIIDHLLNKVKDYDKALSEANKKGTSEFHTKIDITGFDHISKDQATKEIMIGILKKFASHLDSSDPAQAALKQNFDLAIKQINS